MANFEEEIMQLIGAAGDSKDKSFSALAALKDGDVDKAKEFIQQAHETDVTAHNVQTKLIAAEMDPDQESAPMTLLMAHAQDHYMTSQLARDLVEQFIEVFEAQFKK